MSRDDPEELRARARRYRERADRELHDPVVTEAFYQIAATLERRAMLSGPVVLDAPRSAGRFEVYHRQSRS